ncbi:MAG: hypothetical protein FD153_651 [Rhodospirillaceae bacterium]|nr:MAG: hypothetical protein FD153_651 [Rhodospirillaceae bacterium]
MREDSPFAVVTVARLLTQMTRADMTAHHGGEMGSGLPVVVRAGLGATAGDLTCFAIIDWMMRLPEALGEAL